MTSHKRKNRSQTEAVGRSPKGGAITTSVTTRVYPPGLKIIIKNDRVLTDAGKKAVKNGVLALDDVLLFQE